MVDVGRVLALLERLQAETDELAKLRDSEALPGDETALAAAKYRFIVAIGTCIDVAEHVIASEGLRSPDSFAEAFAVLGDVSFIEEDLAADLQDMARFRNLLVHGYQRVDDARVAEILRTRLDDFERFRAAIARVVS
ncbi:MAG TPA: DUF86 domain-containing protein [Actinomycetota bacterium]